MADSRICPPICLGVITAAHGVKGLVKIKPFTATPEGIAAYGAVRLDDGTARTLSLRGCKGGMVIAAIDGIADRDAAEALKGQAFHIDRAALPDAEAGAIYHADLIGRAVHDKTRGAIGKVIGVHDFGGGQLLEVDRGGSKKDSVLIPFGNDMEMKDDTITLDINPAWLED